MTVWRRGRLVLLLLLLAASTSIPSTCAVKTGTLNSRRRPYRVLSKQTRRKVRGSSTKDPQRRRRRKLKSGATDDDYYHDDKYYDDDHQYYQETGGSKRSGGMMMMTMTAYSEDISSPATKSRSASHTKSSTKKSMGGGSKTKGSRSQRPSPSKSMMKKSMKSMMGGMMSASNIFEHGHHGEREDVQVQCGSDEMPFLTTFVTSIQLQAPGEAGGNKKNSKKQRGKGGKIDVDAGEDDEDDVQADLFELPNNDLSPSEMRTLEETFRMVYNNWTNEMCDGFFRTVYTVTLTLVEKDEEEDEYAVTLENTYRMAGNGHDVFDLSVENGTFTGRVAGQGRAANATSTTRQANVTYYAPQKHYDGRSGAEDDPETHVQTVSGSDDVPIYYVSLAATCRNCDVTDEVNFPLLMHPEDGYVSVNRIGTRRLEEEDGIDVQDADELEGEEATTVKEEPICTCSLPADDGPDAETYRRQRRRRRRRRLDSDDLYVPQPMGPTPEQYVAAMNAAIEKLQETEGRLLRIAGLVDLIEPDYFEGENPELMTPPSTDETDSSTDHMISTLEPSMDATDEPPLYPPTANATLSPTASAVSPGNGTGISNNGTISNANGTTVPVTSPTLAPFLPPQTNPSSGSRDIETLAPTSSASSRLCSSWHTAVLSLVLGGFLFAVPIDAIA